MRIGNRTFNGPRLSLLVLPRDDGDIVFKAQAVIRVEEFSEFYPKPSPPGILKAGEQVSTPNLNDPEYKNDLSTWFLKFRDWLFLKSLEVTPDLIWEKVDIKKPETYDKINTELQEAGFIAAEINRLREFALSANTLNEDRLEELKKRFLAGNSVQE